MRRFVIPLLAAAAVFAEDPPEVRAVITRMEKAIAEAETTSLLAQGKAMEAAAKDLEKLLAREKKGSDLAVELKTRIDQLNAEAALLKDQPLYRAVQIEKALAAGTFTVKEWNAVVTDMQVTIDAKEEWTQTKFRMQEGEIWLIVPHPSDTWTGHVGNEMVNYLGHKGDVKGGMRLAIRIGDKDKGRVVSNRSFLLRSGAGALYLGCADSGDWGDNGGAIKVKLLKVR